MPVLEKAPKARKGRRTEPQEPQVGAAQPNTDATGKAQPSPPCRILLVATGKGGSQKTTTAIHMAVAASRAGYRAAILDLDSQATATKWARKRADLGAEVEATVACEAAPMSQANGKLDEMLTGGYDLIVVDTPPTLDTEGGQTRSLVERADYVLVPTSAYPVDIESVKSFMATVEVFGARGAYVLSKVRRNAKMTIEAKSTLNKAGGDLYAMEVRQLDDIALAIDWGATVFEVKGASGADDMGDLWEFVRKGVGL